MAVQGLHVLLQTSINTHLPLKSDRRDLPTGKFQSSSHLKSLAVSPTFTAISEGVINRSNTVNVSLSFNLVLIVQVYLDIPRRLFSGIHALFVLASAGW